MDFLAHRSSDGREQTVREHLLQTAELSRMFAIDELKDICYLLGLLHDIGKYKKGFQDRIRGKAIAVEHAICGALEIEEKDSCKLPLKVLLELCIAGHHTGIPDCGSKADDASLYGRLFRKTEGDYSIYADELPEVVSLLNDREYLLRMSESLNKFLINGLGNKDIKGLIEKYAFIIRYCFSCLTDADSLDTMSFEGAEKGKDFYAEFERCADRLENRLKSYSAVTRVQKARSSLSRQAIENIDDSEVYLMHMPTGSGKTLASMRCALKMARENGLKRIIYVIPYNSIIDQTANVFENLFEEDGNVLRHQSSFAYEILPDKDEEYCYSAIKSCENWDADIIITTVVQFFESLYGNKRGKLRKVHNMADSVIVFDEAHLMPREYLQPCLSGIGYIARILRSKVMFLTATMPDYTRLLHKYALKDLKISELIKDTSEFVNFNNVQYKYLDEISVDELIPLVDDSAASLVVMNTRRGAREIYSLCGNKKKYHLSTYMTGFDREHTIELIKADLDNLYSSYGDLKCVPEEQKITVVSTSLIEAGVDLDFCEAFREIAGLDNILQTGGRCNREGKREEGITYVFKRSDETKPMKPNQSITQGIIKEYSDISESDAIRNYYERLLYTESANFEKKAVSYNCSSLNRIDFKTYSENFKIIDDTRTVSIVVVRDENSQELLDFVKMTGKMNRNKVQRYCCSVYQNEFEELLKQGVLEDFGSGVFFLINQDYYDPLTGIQLSGKDYYI